MKIFTKQKILALGVCAFFLSVVYIMYSASPVLAQEIQVIVNGQNVQFPDQKPFINKDNRTLVPVRAPMEAAGAAVTWNDTARQATVAKGGKTAVFSIGSKQYTVNGEIKQMDTEAQIAGNRTVFPIRFVAEAIGLTVTWGDWTKVVGVMEPLTAEAKERLMNYPYQPDIEVWVPMGKYTEEREKSYIQNKDQSILSEKGLIKSNQRFYFDSDLCFNYDPYNKEYAHRIRGILQTRNNDGTITEQDVEFGYGIKISKVFVTESLLKEGNDFIELSAPVSLKKD